MLHLCDGMLLSNKKEWGPGTVDHPYNPNTLGSRGRQVTWGQEFGTSLANMAKLCPTKNTKIGRVQWLIPVIPALWEAKAGRSPEVKSSRPAWSIWLNPISTKNTKISWVWWLMPVIPELWEAKVGGSPEVKSSRPAWSTWWNPISTKNTKISQEWWQENYLNLGGSACSEPRLCHCTPTRMTEQDSIKKAGGEGRRNFK